MTSGPRRGGRGLRFLGRVHGVAAAVYAGALAAEASAIAAQLRSNPEVAATLAAGRDLGAGTPVTGFGAGRAFDAWVLGATARLGHATAVETVEPLLLAAIGLVAAVAAVRSVAGGWAAGMALGLGVAASPLVLVTALAPGFHGLVICLTGVVSLLLAMMSRGRLGRRAHLVGGAIGLVGGAAAAVDPLLLAAAGLPLLAAGVTAAAARRDRTIVTALLAVTVPGAVAFAVLWWWQGAAFGTTPPGLQHGDLGVAARGLVDLVDGMPVGPSEPLGRLPTVVGVAALLLALAAATAALVRAARSVAGAEMGTRGDAVAQVAHLVFWGCAAGLLVVAILVAPVIVSEPVTTVGERLLSTQGCLAAGWLALVATVALWPRGPRSRAIAAVAASLLIVAATARVVAATTENAFSERSSPRQPSSFVQPGHQGSDAAAALHPLEATTVGAEHGA